MRKYTQHTKNELNTQKMSSTHKKYYGLLPDNRVRFGKSQRNSSWNILRRG